jgi:hypothetical protein
LQRCAKKIGNGDTRDFAGILKGHEKAAPRPLVRLKFENVFAIH